MIDLETIASLPVVQTLGWTLLHFLWHGALIGAAVAIVLSMMSLANANAR